MDRYVRGHRLKDNVMIASAREDMDNLVKNIEIAEYQKGLDAACEVVNDYNLGGQLNYIKEKIEKL